MGTAFARSQGERCAIELGSGSPPIDVYEIATKLNIRVIDAELGPDVSGLLVTTPGQQITICVKHNDLAVRKRFTIAHELAHHILGHQFQPGSHVHVDRGNFISQRGTRASQGIDAKEIEANQFAAALLMPSPWIRTLVAEIQRRSPLHDHHVVELANRFIVSEQAMTIRLSSLRLL
jgi:Zn-dependent peptidase ImmA (M78 family)